MYVGKKSRELLLFNVYDSRQVAKFSPCTTEADLIDFFRYVVPFPTLSRSSITIYLTLKASAESKISWVWPWLVLLMGRNRIKSIDFKEDSRTAVVHFEKPSAAKTALMLNGGILDHAPISVTSDTQPEDEAQPPHVDDAPYEQSDKPRAGIVAEILAKGYILSDTILHRAIELDNERGISKRFLSYIYSLDSRIGEKAVGPDRKISTHVQETIRHVDEQRGISKTASDYFERAISSGLGRQIKDFYTTTSKNILDIHEEARRIARLNKAATTSDSSGTASAEDHPIKTTTNAGVASPTLPPPTASPAGV